MADFLGSKFTDHVTLPVTASVQTKQCCVSWRDFLPSAVTDRYIHIDHRQPDTDSPSDPECPVDQRGAHDGLHAAEDRTGSVECQRQQKDVSTMEKGPCSRILNKHEHLQQHSSDQPATAQDEGQQELVKQPTAAGTSRACLQCAETLCFETQHQLQDVGVVGHASSVGIARMLTCAASARQHRVLTGNAHQQMTLSPKSNEDKPQNTSCRIDLKPSSKEQKGHATSLADPTRGGSAARRSQTKRRKVVTGLSDESDDDAQGDKAPMQSEAGKNRSPMESIQNPSSHHVNKPPKVVAKRLPVVDRTSAPVMCPEKVQESKQSPQKRADNPANRRLLGTILKLAPCRSAGDNNTGNASSQQSICCFIFHCSYCACISIACMLCIRQASRVKRLLEL